MKKKKKDRNLLNWSFKELTSQSTWRPKHTEAHANPSTDRHAHTPAHRGSHTGTCTNAVFRGLSVATVLQQQIMTFWHMFLGKELSSTTRRCTRGGEVSSWAQVPSCRKLRVSVDSGCRRLQDSVQVFSAVLQLFIQILPRKDNLNKCKATPHKTEQPLGRQPRKENRMYLISKDKALRFILTSWLISNWM